MLSIPSTVPVKSASAAHVTTAQARDRRLREAGLNLVTCPSCGKRAAREEVLVHRPGQPTVRRILVRCLAAQGGRHRGATVAQNAARCPVQVQEEDAGTMRPPSARLRALLGAAVRRNDGQAQPEG